MQRDEVLRGNLEGSADIRLAHSLLQPSALHGLVLDACLWSQ